MIRNIVIETPSHGANPGRHYPGECTIAGERKSPTGDGGHPYEASSGPFGGTEARLMGKPYNEMVKIAHPPID